MRRRTPGTVTFAANRTQDWAPSSERRAEESKARPFRTLPTQLVTHPLFGVVLFLIFFPGWALVSSLRQYCAAGELAICCHNNPDPVLTRELEKEPFVPNWRADGRCGSDFPAPSGQLISVCNPFTKQHCCSQWGWCGQGPEFCAQAVKPPYNTTGTGLVATMLTSHHTAAAGMQMLHFLCPICNLNCESVVCSFSEILG